MPLWTDSCVDRCLGKGVLHRLMPGWMSVWTEACVEDLEKVENPSQAENLELYNLLKIVGFPTKDERKYVFKRLVWYDGILKS